MKISAVSNSTAADDLLSRPIEYRFDDSEEGLFTARVRVTKLNASTFEALERLDSDSTDEDALRLIAEAVCAIVIEWNVTDDNEAPVPLTVEAVAAIDAEDLTVLMAAVVKGATSDPKGTSSRSERRAKSRKQG